jgi:hypothetical protein
MRTLYVAILPVIFGVCIAGSTGADEPSRSDTLRPIPAPLKQKVRLADFHVDNPSALVEVIRKRHDVGIGLDFEELQKANKGTLKGIVLPSAEIPLAIGLELVANQMHGTLREVGGRWRIVRGSSELQRLQTPPSEAKRKHYAQPADIDRPIVRAPAHDIVEYLNEKYDVPIWVFPGLLHQAESRLDETICNLPKAQKPLVDWVKDLARQMKAEVRLFDEIILIEKPDSRQN